jgi:gas vesicle protein
MENIMKMNIPNSLSNISWPHISKADVLDALGLAPARSTGTEVASALAIFGAGIMVGAGLGLLFAPRPGAETRTQLATKAGELGTTISTRAGELGTTISTKAGELGSKASEVGADLVNRLPFGQQAEGQQIEAKSTGSGSSYHS